MSVTKLPDALNLSFGNRNLAMVTATGPSSYTQISVGTPPAGPTGGQSISASAFGLKYIDEIIGGLDASGKYIVEATAGPHPGGATSVTLMWIIAHTGAEETGATDLHTYSVQLTAIGR
jgi:hypothetical protein